jgi:hypothetical protein
MIRSPVIHPTRPSVVSPRRHGSARRTGGGDVRPAGPCRVRHSAALVIIRVGTEGPNKAAPTFPRHRPAGPPGSVSTGRLCPHASERAKTNRPETSTHITQPQRPISNFPSPARDETSSPFSLFSSSAQLSASASSQPTSSSPRRLTRPRDREKPEKAPPHRQAKP